MSFVLCPRYPFLFRSVVKAPLAKPPFLSAMQILFSLYIYKLYIYTYNLTYFIIFCITSTIIKLSFLTNKSNVFTKKK